MKKIPPRRPTSLYILPGLLPLLRDTHPEAASASRQVETLIIRHLCRRLALPPERVLEMATKGGDR